MTPKLMSYNQSDFQSKAHMEMSIAEIEKNVAAIGDQMREAGLLSFTVTQVWNKQGKFRTGTYWAYRDEKAFIDCQKLFREAEMELGRRTEIAMKVISNRGVILTDMMF